MCKGLTKQVEASTTNGTFEALATAAIALSPIQLRFPKLLK
jgi:hypothetical protein